MSHENITSSFSGFTLIELAVVLVVIGLVVGGILVGQSLVSAAEVRAQITQIERYQQAVNTFKGKFGYLPGDMRPDAARQFGFTVGAGCNGAQGKRDGNGLIESGVASGGYPLIENDGETALFWQDITSPAAGNLIDGSFPNSGGATETCNTEFQVYATSASQYYPVAKIGSGNFLYVYSDGTTNWFGVSAITSVSNTNGGLLSNPVIPVIQAYRIDVKIDDGMPTTGSVAAAYLGIYNWQISSAPNTATSGGNATSCYDTTTSTYSITVNNGSGANCALSFRFQ